MERPQLPPLSVSQRGTEGGDDRCTVVWVRGEQDVATRAALAAEISAAAQREDMPLLIDLSGITFMDASILGALVDGRNRMRALGRSLQVRAPSAKAMRVLQLCGLADLICPDHVEGPVAVVKVASAPT